MKSYQVELNIHANDRKDYSDLQVLQSAAGWYIGTIYTHPRLEFKEPGSRDSDYFPTEAKAKFALAFLEFTYEESGKDMETTIIYWEMNMRHYGLDPRGVGYRTHP